jgi:hypothetical protein
MRMVQTKLQRRTQQHSNLAQRGGRSLLSPATTLHGALSRSPADPLPPARQDSVAGRLSATGGLTGRTAGCAAAAALAAVMIAAVQAASHECSPALTHLSVMCFIHSNRGRGQVPAHYNMPGGSSYARWAGQSWDAFAVTCVWLERRLTFVP